MRLAQRQHIQLQSARQKQQVSLLVLSEAANVPASTVDQRGRWPHHDRAARCGGCSSFCWPRFGVSFSRTQSAALVCTRWSSRAIRVGQRGRSTELRQGLHRSELCRHLFHLLLLALKLLVQAALEYWT